MDLAEARAALMGPGIIETRPDHEHEAKKVHAQIVAARELMEQAVRDCSAGICSHGIPIRTCAPCMGAYTLAKLTQR
jgi:hypothetical protein